MTSAASKVFNSLFDEIKTVIPFSEKWYNGTGYLDGAVRDVKLEPGARAKSETSGVDGLTRRIILIGTPVGTVVFFERYLPEKDGTRSSIIVNNVPSELDGIIASGPVSDNKLSAFIGADWLNIGHSVQKIFKAGVASVNNQTTAVEEI